MCLDGDDNELDKQQHKLFDLVRSNEQIALSLARFVSRYDYYKWSQPNDKAQLRILIDKYNKKHKGEDAFTFYPDTFIMPKA